MDATSPDSMLAAAEAFRRAVDVIGGQSATGRLVQKTQQAVSARLAANKVIWAESVITVEDATGISRHDLRPDIYPRDSASPRHGAGLDNLAPAR